MKAPLYLLFAGTLLLSLNSCDKDDEARQAACETKGDIVARADKREGRVGFNTALNSYVIRYAHPGSIDSVDEGIVCSLSADLQREGLVVEFSGNYRTYTGPTQPEIGGQQYYYLELTSISAK